jgi:PIN domain nuclease of toxin-antitoxin system
MRILLDTHIWIWYQEGNERLSSSLRKLIESDENLLYLSPISIWETLILGEKKRVLLEPTPEDWVRDSLAQLEVIEVPLSYEVMFLSRQLDLVHQDPADRFIAATAVYYDLVLATVDKNLTSASFLKTIH